MFPFSVYCVGVFLLVELSKSQHGTPSGINGAYFETYDGATYNNSNLRRRPSGSYGAYSKTYNLNLRRKTNTVMDRMYAIGLRKRRSVEFSDTNAMANMRKLMAATDEHVLDATTPVFNGTTTTMLIGTDTREQTNAISNFIDLSYDSEYSVTRQNTTESSNNTIHTNTTSHARQTDIISNLIDLSHDSEASLENTTESSNCTPHTIPYSNQTRQSKAGLLSQGWVSAATYQAINSAVLRASLPLLIIVIVLCFFSTVVYSMKSMKCPTSVYLISINITEMLYAVVSLVAYITGNIYGDKAMSSYIYLHVGIYLNNYVGIALKRSTFCVTSFVSAERMIVVAFPLKSKHFRLIRNPALIVVLTIVSSFVFHIFSALKYTIVPYQAPVTNETLWKLEFTDLKDPIEKWSLSSKVLFVYTPLILTLLLNFGTVLSIRRHNQARRLLNINDDDKSDARERQTTIVILVSTFVFVFLALPTVTNSLVSNLATEYGPYTKEHYLFFSITRLGGFCGFLSSATNFLFYMTLSSKFRQSFLTLIPCIRRKLRKKQHITTQNSSMTQSSSITNTSRRSISSNL